MPWRVEFDRDAARDLRKLDVQAQRQILRYLRERIAADEDPRRFGYALTRDLKGLWRYRVGDFRIGHRSRMTASSCSWSPSDTGVRCMTEGAAVHIFG